MRYLSLFFFLFLSLHSYFVFADQQYLGSYCDSPSVCVSFISNLNAKLESAEYGSSCTTTDNPNYACASVYQRCPSPLVNYDVDASKCVPVCTPPQILNIKTVGGVFTPECIDEPDTETPPDSCPEGQVKNIETGQCEAKTECEYPQLYDSFSNSCYANPNNCAEGAKPNPLEPGTCTAYGETSCPSGWVPVNEGLNCAPDPNASSSGNASSGAPASSSGNASSTPTSNPSNSSSTPSTGGDGDGDGSSGSGSGGGGDGSTGGTGGSGSASSSNSSGAGSGNGSGGSGECDPTAKNYLDCISEESGDEGDGLDDINQKDYSLNIGERLQQARDNYTDRLNDIKDDLTQELSVSLGAGSGSLPSDRIELYGQTVEMGIYARKDFFDAIRWIFLAVASVVSLYIVLSKGN